jgi:mRNA interferase MazF
MSKGKIVLVSFPFDDFSIQKVRPALCLTDPMGQFSHVVVAFISSKVPENIEQTDFIIDPDQVAWGNTGLLTTSYLRLHKLVSIPLSLILRELGDFPELMENELSEKIKLMFQLK